MSTFPHNKLVESADSLTLLREIVFWKFFKLLFQMIGTRCFPTAQKENAPD